MPVPLSVKRIETRRPGAGSLYVLDQQGRVSRALSGAEIAAMHGAGPLGLCRPSQPPVIVSQPASRTTACG